MRAEISFLTSGRKPQCPPNPAHPLGIDVDISEGATRTCKATLPYPAAGCGAWMVKCLDCGYVAAVTAAGRVDDPRTVKFACKSATQ